MPGGMPTGPVVAPAAPPAVGAPAARPSIFSGFLGTVMRMGAMWLVMSFLRPKTAPVAGPGEVLSKSFPKFPKGYPMDMYAFISEKPALREYDMGSLIWSERGVELGGKGTRSVSVPYEPSPAVQHNGSVYLHVVFAPPKKPINPSEPGYDESSVFAASHNLVKYISRPKNDTGVNLLSNDALPTKEQVYNKTVDIISVFKPNLTIQIVDHFTTYPHRSSVPDPLKPFVMFDPDGHHYPILHINEFWLLRDKMIPLNDTVSNVTLHLELSTVSAWWWQLMTAMEQSFKTQAGWGMQQEGESDELKRILLEGNPYLLVLTFFVSMLHTVFDLLAFKNDIGFWKNNKSMEGLSARTVVINAACQVVILLYLFDSDTSYVVLLSATLGTAIEIWKVSKAFKMTVDRTKFPYIKLEDRASYSVAQTKQHDADAIRYLSYVLLPLVIGYSIYTLKYKTHKSWYSWVVSTLVGAVYMFGFILMCPQLYLNYKLKSVAHLPWRQLTYKFLNTIIDDLFAFVIKMPLLHRLSVFRDDLVFLVYLYQRWIYRVDLTRTNEFGYSGIEPGAEGTEPVTMLEETETPATSSAAGAITTAVKRSTRAATAAAADADVPPATGAVVAEPKKDK